MQTQLISETSASTIGLLSNKKRSDQIGFFLATLLIYLAFHHYRPITHKAYIYLADSFVKGSISIENPSKDLIEIIHYRGGNYFAYGVMPAILLMPLVAIWGLAVNQGLVVMMLGAFNVALLCGLLHKLRYPRRVVFWVTILFAFGTVHFLAATWATPWFFMHISAVFFLLLAINETFNKDRAILIGLYVGAAFLSRNPVLVATPFFLLLINQKGLSLSRNLYFTFGLMIGVLLNSLYNFARFDNFLDNGYARIFNQPYGMFSLHYLKHNLFTYALAPPVWIGKFPYLSPSLHGMSLFLTTPAFLYICKALQKDLVTIASWSATVGIGCLYLVYFWDGFAQFGVRYTLDYTPFLMLLIAKAFGSGLSRSKISLVCLSILINIWGILWWRFGHLVAP